MRTLVFGISFICYAAAAFVTVVALGSRPADSGEGLVVFPSTSAARDATPDGDGGLQESGGHQVDQMEQTIVGIRQEMLAREAAILERVTREQEASRSAVEELQETIAGLRSEIARRDSTEPAEQAAVEEIRETIAELRSEIAREDLAGSGGAGDTAKRDALENITSGGETSPPAGGTPSLPRGEENTGQVVAILGGGLFPSGQDVLSREIEGAVEKVLPAIVAHPDHRIVVEGHADSVPIGDKVADRVVDNRALSLLRAEKIALLLVEQGVLRERITVFGRGDSRPLAPNDTPEGRAENRRVEIRLVPPAGP